MYAVERAQLGFVDCDFVGQVDCVARLKQLRRIWLRLGGYRYLVRARLADSTKRQSARAKRLVVLRSSRRWFSTSLASSTALAISC